MDEKNKLVEVLESAPAIIEKADAHIYQRPWLQQSARTMTRSTEAMQNLRLGCRYHSNADGSLYGRIYRKLFSIFYGVPEKSLREVMVNAQSDLESLAKTADSAVKEAQKDLTKQREKSKASAGWLNTAKPKYQEMEDVYTKLPKVVEEADNKTEEEKKLEQITLDEQAAYIRDLMTDCDEEILLQETMIKQYDRTIDRLEEIKDGARDIRTSARVVSKIIGANLNLADLYAKIEQMIPELLEILMSVDGYLKTIDKSVSSFRSKINGAKPRLIPP